MGHKRLRAPSRASATSITPLSVGRGKGGAGIAATYIFPINLPLRGLGVAIGHAARHPLEARQQQGEEGYRH